MTVEVGPWKGIPVAAPSAEGTGGVGGEQDPGIPDPQLACHAVLSGEKKSEIRA